MAAGTGQDQTEALVEQVRRARAARVPLRIVGGDTRRFYGRAIDAEPLRLHGHAGVVNYDPAELVVTVRSGTPLAELEALLRQDRQCLPFEPPSFGTGSTVGGMIAAGLAGPARAARGPVRDYVLGVRLLAGDGRVLRFGGEVMKNVAGYDVARLLAGSLGTLGILLEVSLKVLPLPVASCTRRLQADAAQAIALLAGHVQQGLPVSASFWHDDQLWVRLDASNRSLERAAATLGGEPATAQDAELLWRAVRDQRHAFFAAHGARRLWRMHVPADAPVAPMTALGDWAFEWNGAQRWCHDPDPTAAHRIAAAGTGHASLFRGAMPGEEVFAALAPAALQLHREVKRVFDPDGILNAGRMYASF
ncbi:MAG: glycolate oxidase subunit GlcE [Steroidobacteraceae bacterium]